MELGVAVIGCGLIGTRRAEVAARHSSSALRILVDSNPETAREAGDRFGCASSGSWQDALARPEVGVVVIATPNRWLAEIAIAALESGRHVLVEKPMGRNLLEAQALAASAARCGRVLKIGFNHRYHPAILESHRRFSAGDIGRLINLRARYGHGGRPGYELEWRGSVELAGGGELTDQGVHIADLIHWFAGLPSAAFGMLQTAVWPLDPLEDNAFGLFRFEGGAVASMHTTWTQWKNLFSFEVFGERGSLIVEGLGKSYGPETLRVYSRNMKGGAPEEQTLRFDGPDRSWELEWEDFTSAVEHATSYYGTPQDGLAAMRMIDALYRSAQTQTPATICEQARK